MAGQIVETRFGDGEAERFAYDPALNLCGLGDATSRVQAWQLAAGGRVERDGFRPKTWRYGWDAQDRLVACETPEGERWAYGYDAFGRRVWKRRLLDEGEEAWVRGKFPLLVRSVAAGGRSALDVWQRRPAGASEVDVNPPVVGVAYLWDGDVVAQEAALRLDGSAEWDRATSWHFAPGTFVPVAKEEADGRLRYVVTDHLGTPREVFAEDGGLVWAAEYRTWGAVRRLWLAEADNDNRGGGGWGLGRSSGRAWGGLALEEAPAAAAAMLVCPIRFQGQWQDAETELVYTRFRYYDPLAGQYASTDPIGLVGGFRGQGYVVQPIGWFDPKGLACCPLPVKNAVNSNMPHAIERSLERGMFSSAEVAKLQLNNLSSSIKNNNWPDGAFLDPSYADRVLVPVGNNGLANYQVGENRTAKLKKILIARLERRYEQIFRDKIFGF